MRIALFHEVVSGGARRGANEFAKTLREKGNEVDLYIVDNKRPQEEKVYYDKVFFYEFISKVWHGKNWKIKLYKDTLELWSLYNLHKKIAKDMQRNQYDFAFIHPSQYTQAPFILQLLSLPKLYYCREPLRMIYEKDMDITDSLDFFRRRYERVMRKMRKVIDRKNISSADIIFANSSFTQQNIRQAYKLESIVCHMGVDPKRFYETTKKKDIDILYIGSEDPIDGYTLFQQTVSYFTKHYHIEFLLRGKKWLNNDEELREYYSRAKLVICFGRHEPFGLIPLEAMSCGAVVIAINEGGYKDSVIDNKTGFLVPEDPKKIARIITNVLAKPLLLKRMSQDSIALIDKDWLWKKSVDIILSQYNIWQKNQ